VTGQNLFNAFLYLNARYEFGNSFCWKFFRIQQKLLLNRSKKTVCFLIENATTLTIRTTYDVIKIARLESADRESDRW